MITFADTIFAYVILIICGYCFAAMCIDSLQQKHKVSEVFKVSNQICLMEGYTNFLGFESLMFAMKIDAGTYLYIYRKRLFGLQNINIIFRSPATGYICCNGK